MKKLGTYLSLLVLSICCMTGVSFAAGISYEPMEPTPGYVITKSSNYYDDALHDYVEYTYQFDKAGNVTYQKTQTTNWDDSTTSFELTNTYDNAGNLLSSLSTSEDYYKKIQYDGAGHILSTEEKGNGWEDNEQCTYDENKNLIKVESHSRIQSREYTSICIKTYDENNNLIREEKTTVSNDVLLEETSTNTYTTLYTYNAAGLLETVTETNEQNSDTNTTHYVYNDHGFILEEDFITTTDGIEKFKKIEIYSYNGQDKILTDKTMSYNYGELASESLVEYAYNQYGSCTQIKTNHDTITYEYDENQNNISVTSTTGQRTVCEYAKISELNAPTSPFVDVQNPKSYCYDAVLWAVENGVTNGYDETHFLPNRSCTRAQIVTFLWRAAGSPEPSSNNNPFTDVKDGPYYKAILWAVEKGITKGTTATTFAPNAACTRAQIVTFIYRAAGEPQIQNSTNPFTDVKGGAYYKAILWAVDSGITKGTTATTFAPSATCTRGQGVTFLYRGRDLLQ